MHKRLFLFFFAWLVCFVLHYYYYYYYFYLVTASHYVGSTSQKLSPPALASAVLGLQAGIIIPSSEDQF